MRALAIIAVGDSRILSLELKMKFPTRFLISALVALPLSTMAGPVFAAGTGQDHGHAVHGTMELKQGQKWETDAPLRQGMSALHEIVSTSLTGAHANTLTPNDYQKISKDVMTQFTYVVENCKLEPEADAQLHILLGNIVQGVEVIEGNVSGEEPEAGLKKLAQALNEYGSHFNHPNWAAIDVAH
jgi:hypothetical protein